MPSYPDISQSANLLTFSGFGSTADRINTLSSQGLLIPLHLGDTYLPPPAAAKDISLQPEYLYRYGPNEGFPELRREISSRINQRFGLFSTNETVFVTPGAIGALSLVADALFDPGEEVIVLTPSWPVIFGILTRRGLQVVEVPVGPDGVPESESNSFAARLRTAISPNCKGIYFCNPNNPSGFILNEEYASTIVSVALQNDLWLLEDIAYGELVFNGKFSPITIRPEVRDRSVIVGTFSKSHALAGHRIGYICVPSILQGLIGRLLMHTTYHTSTVAQSMALACLKSSEEEQKTLASYKQGASIANESLKCIAAPAEAGGFVFLDFRPYVSPSRPISKLFDVFLDRYVALCPGKVFGCHFESFARLCFTATPPELLEEGISRINDVLAKLEDEHA